jgi:hypothetical protein
MHHKIPSSILVKQKTTEQLEIEVCCPLVKGIPITVLGIILGMLIYAIFVVICSISGGLWGIFVGIFGGSFFTMTIMEHLDEKFSKPVLHSIQLDASRDRFLVINKKRSLDVMTIKISEIRVLSTYHSRKVNISMGAYQNAKYSHSLYGIRIQARKKHLLRWELGKGECIFLVNIIQGWLDKMMSLKPSPSDLSDV